MQMVGGPPQGERLIRIQTSNPAAFPPSGFDQVVMLGSAPEGLGSMVLFSQTREVEENCCQNQFGPQTSLSLFLHS